MFIVLIVTKSSLEKLIQPKMVIQFKLRLLIWATGSLNIFVDFVIFYYFSS